MKLIGCFVLLLAICTTPSLYGQGSKPFFFAGRWINTQYEEFTNKHKDGKFLEHISPQFLSIDSAYKLTIISRMEQSSELGKPVLKRNFGTVQELTYRKKFEIWLVQIPGETNLIAMTFEYGGTIIFRRE